MLTSTKEKYAASPWQPPSYVTYSTPYSEIAASHSMWIRHKMSNERDTNINIISGRYGSPASAGSLTQIDLAKLSVRTMRYEVEKGDVEALLTPRVRIVYYSHAIIEK